MYNIVLVSLPFTSPEVPPLGIAVLKGAVEHAGFKCKTLDLGFELFKKCNFDQDLFDSIQEYWINPKFDKDERLPTQVQEFINEWSVKLLSFNSTWIGFSVFTSYSQLSTYLMCKQIKKLKPNCQIVIGGPGANVKTATEISNFYKFSTINKMSNFGESLKQQKLIDCFIAGDGEEPLISLLKNQSIGSEYNKASYRNTEYGYANFDDFDLDLYQGQLNRGYTQLPIFTSKGCVRNCDFCDVNYLHQGYRFRQGKNVVKEMIHLADQTGIRDFIMLDSVANGSIKNLKEWVIPLADYNLQNPTKKITWSASGWICRPTGQMSVDFYKTLSVSGLQSVSIGVESGSDRVLDAMNKKTNVDALYHEVEQFSKNGMQFIALMMIGHWSEHWEDFLLTCQLMYKLSKYARNGTLVAVNPGFGFAISSGAPVDQDPLTSKIISKSRRIWWTPLNPKLTFKERIFRVILFEKFLRHLKIPLMLNAIPVVHHQLTQDFPDIDDFYLKFVPPSTTTLPSEYYWNNFDKFVELVINENNDDQPLLNIDIDLVGSVVNEDPPIIDIVLNKKLLFSNRIDDGETSIKLSNLETLPNLENKLDIHFYNKKWNDTIVDDQGNILKDKFVLLKKLSINGINLLEDEEFFYKKLVYKEKNQIVTPKTGFWLNDSKLTIKFENPFLLWFNKNSMKFSKLDGAIITPGTLPGLKNKTEDQTQTILEKIVDLLNKLSV
jgi:anaerobic magnesium-protoporphyrin IX monomethyl ester cyclase